LQVVHLLQQCTLDRDKPFVLEPHVQKINSIFGHQTLEEIFDSLRQDGSEWATAQLATLNKMVSHYTEMFSVSLWLRFWFSALFLGN